tara:strand:+ start:1687 stop:2358 length:672 start_codon:yes stop_codon:yes gene_type:complete
MKDLTLIIPAKNESESLPKVLGELKEFDVNIKIILHREDVMTIDSIKNFNCDIVYQSNKGYGDALIQGILETKTKYFCIFNADGSFNPNELGNMLDKTKMLDLDFNFASRYQKGAGSDDDTLITSIGNFIFTTIGKIFFKLTITDILYTFVLGKTDSAKKINLTETDFCFCVELPIKARRLNLSMISQPSWERKRIAGKKKVNEFQDGLKILFYMIKLFFKNK